MNSRTAIRDNVLYSVLDYASQPVLMLVATPFLLHGLGAQQYGTWMLVNSIAGVATGLGGGFGDGATRYVAKHRGRGDRPAVLRTFAAVLAVHSTFGLISAAVLIAMAPYLIGHVFTIEPSLRAVAVAAVRISAAILLLRFVESVFVAAIRGCERYRPTVIVSISARVLTVGAAVMLVAKGHSLVAILWTTLVGTATGLACQGLLAGSILQIDADWRAIDLRAGIREVFSFGAFTWIKSSLGVLVAYADRLLVAGLLGAGSLAYYSLCNQLTQPIPALLASAFNFIFPRFSAQNGAAEIDRTRRFYRRANALVFVVVAASALFFLTASYTVLRIWIGSAVAEQYAGLLRLVAIGNCLLALSVVPQYAALAFGRARNMMLVNFAAGAVSLPAGYLLMQHVGIAGAGFGKILAGAAFLAAFRITRSALDHSTEKPESVDAAGRETALDFAR